jgi:hypothetical protein
MTERVRITVSGDVIVEGILKGALPEVAEPPKPKGVDGAAGPGFASFRWGGRLWTFTPKQRQVVSVLHQAYLDDTPDVPQAVLLSECESEGGHLRNLFSGHEAWGTLIVRSSAMGGPRDCYRLADPATIS